MLVVVLSAIAFSAGSVLGQTGGSQLVAPDWCRTLPRPEYARLERVAVKDEWFEVYRVAPGVLAIYEPHQWQETVMYLVEGSERALLIDTGMGIGDLRGLANGLTRLPVEVVNTHTHYDHVSGNWQFERVDNLDSDYSRENAKGSTEIRGELAPGDVCGALPKGFDAAKYATRAWRTTRWLRDGDGIDLGGRRLKVLATPGHSPDSIALFDERNGLLFTGDTYYQGPIYVFEAGADVAAYQGSVDRLAVLAPKVRLVLGAHNVPGNAPSVLPELAKEFRELRTGRLRAMGTEDGATKFLGAQDTFLVRASDVPGAGSLK